MVIYLSLHLISILFQALAPATTVWEGVIPQNFFLKSLKKFKYAFLVLTPALKHFGLQGFFFLFGRDLHARLRGRGRFLQALFLGLLDLLFFGQGQAMVNFVNFSNYLNIFLNFYDTMIYNDWLTCFVRGF